jgi:ATP-dependent helicase HrpB
VLQAPPGAGKTTLVPLALRDEPWVAGQRIVMLEPRRLAARAAAHRMAFLLGESVGETVGYRVRMDSRVGPRTRIEVVTEGILTRVLQDDATLDGVACVIFDEFHERSVHADVGLALTLETQRLVRPDLRVLVMSATLDTAPVARLLGDAPVITSEGRLFPVETRYTPPRPDVPLPVAVARVVRAALEECEGDLLVFLPGAREIAAVERLLAEAALPGHVFVAPLFGAMPLDAQDRAIAPAPPGERKIVLSTSIAETSLPIEGTRVVIDSGVSRVPRFSPRTGMTHLETTRVTRAAADQRRGRAGRVAPGTCYRLWPEHETAQLLPFASPESLEADLAPLLLDLAVAGAGDPRQLQWLDPPPAAALAQAAELLRELEAIGAEGQATPHGRQMAALGAHPRLAHMMLRASARSLGALGADVAAILGQRDLLCGIGGPPPADLGLRLDLLRTRRSKAPTGNAQIDHGGVQRARTEAAQWRRQLGARPDDYDDGAIGELVALAYPDRLARRREGKHPRFVMRDGGGAVVREEDALATSPWLAIAETDGRSPHARVFLAAPIGEEAVARAFASQIEERETVEWDSAAGEVRALRRVMLGKIGLSEHAITNPDPSLVRDAIRSAIEREGLEILPWSDEARALRQRLAFLHAHDSSWPDVSDHALLQRFETWIGPRLDRVRRRTDLAKIDMHGALESLLDTTQRRLLADLAPTHIVVPSGSRIPVNYESAGSPALFVRLQEMFGCVDTPRLMRGKVPVTLHLLSPASRPVQVTRDLAGFWRTAYFDVRKDLKGRYPKHHWPDDPLVAEPTRHARRRG